MEEKIINYFLGNLSRSERIELLKEALSDPGLKAQMIDYQHLQSLIDLRPDTMDVVVGKQKYVQFIKRVVSQKRNKIVLSFMRYAAIGVVLIIATWMAATYHYVDKSVSQITAQQELYVPAGQRARLTLPDGSKVWLNAGSRLLYPSVFKKERKVTLFGEGFFEVAKNEKIPFIVSTHSMDVKALGTQFNVFSYPSAGYASVYLLEGSVKVYKPDTESGGVVLTPSQYLVEKTGRFTLETMDQDNLLWRDGIYTFKKQRLADIIKKLELYYDVNIIIEDPIIQNYEYTGKFRQRDGVLEILRVIQRIHKFNIIQDEQLNNIVLKR